MTVGHAPGVMVAGGEQVGDFGGIVRVLDRGCEEIAHQALDLLLTVAGVAVPDHARGGEGGDLRGQHIEGIEARMRVIDDAEMPFGALAGGDEGVGARVFFVAGDLHLVSAFVADAVGADPVVIPRGGLQAGQADLLDLVVHVRDAVAAALDLAGALHVLSFGKEHVTVGHVADGEGHAHARGGVVL